MRSHRASTETATQTYSNATLCDSVFTIEFQDGLGDWCPLAALPTDLRPRAALGAGTAYFTAQAAADALVALVAAREQGGWTAVYRVIQWSATGRVVVGAC